MTFNPFSIISIVLFSDFISLPQNQHDTMDGQPFAHIS